LTVFYTYSARPIDKSVRLTAALSVK
jgi:hypothetical protein